MKIYPTAHPEWGLDHFVLAVGLDARGLTVNTTWGSWLGKVEVAWIHGIDFAVAEPFDAPDLGRIDVPVGTVNTHRLDVMLGVEYYGLANVTVAFDVVNRHIHDYDDRMDAFAVQRNTWSMALRVTASFLRERLETTLLAVGFGGHAEDGSLVRLSAAYDLRDALVLTGGGEVTALDAKMNFDDNALFRHKDVADMRDEDEEDAMELEAARHELNYIKLDGTIGCMVNGAGLAMATMDIIKLYGGEPANFLDVGGGATKERVTAAFKIILSDPNVQGILVNIFGGIMRCDVIAEGIVAAAREVSLTVPLVVRLEGTNVELGRQILAQSNLAITTAENLADAAEKVVAAVKEAA